MDCGCAVTGLVGGLAWIGVLSSTGSDGVLVDALTWAGLSCSGRHAGAGASLVSRSAVWLR